METDQEEFVAALRRLVQNPGGPLGQDLTWVSGRATPDGAVVLYRQEGVVPVLGWRYEMAWFAAMFGSESTMRELAEITYVNDLRSPDGGAGVRLDVDWADGLVEDPAEVAWLGEAPAR